LILLGLAILPISRRTCFSGSCEPPRNGSSGKLMAPSLKTPLAARRRCAHSYRSAFAVNFFDAWRDSPLGDLGKALGLGALPESLSFEYKPLRYPVGPCPPNFDLLLSLEGGHHVAIESKFAEPFRAPGEDAPLSPKYFPDGVDLGPGRTCRRTAGRRAPCCSMALLGRRSTAEAHARWCSTSRRRRSTPTLLSS
jgi:hypothetical protein